MPAEAQPYLDLVPDSLVIDLAPLTARDLCDTVGELKAISMRGADGWSYGELKMIPAVAFTSLAAIFGWIESNRRWPTVLAQWFIILLRKSEVDTPSWSDLRPITVASSLYRLWARIRARRILATLRERGTGLVRVNLPTTTIWGFVSDFLDFHDHLGDDSHPSGIVLDIVKAFNTLNRAILRELMRKAGIPIGFIDAWIFGLDQMTRRVNIQGNHFGACTGCTGVPEGDPLSVVAMWAFSRLFACVVEAHSTPVLTTPVTYADNWEVLSGSCREVIALYPVLASFLQACRLPIAPRKCWAWALQAADRKTLKQIAFGEEPLPVVLRQKDLGADMAYCYGIAAATRNGRVRSGTKRLVRLAGVPGGFDRKVGIIRKSVWKHTLHGAETSLFPKCAAKRLRTKVCRALHIDKAGRSPWLVCNVLTGTPLDPQFEVLVNRVRLVRQQAKFLGSQWGRIVFQVFRGDRPGYCGVIRRLFRTLASLGWYPYSSLAFEDGSGRRFHLVLTTLDHIVHLLQTSWLEKVAENVSHRKGLQDLTTIDTMGLRHWRHLDPSARGLLRTQAAGVAFTAESRSHYQEGPLTCPFCGGQDTRRHRVLQCPHFEDLRVRWDATIPLQRLPASALEFGLWPEIDEARPFQAACDSISFPAVDQVEVEQIVEAFTDGSCLHPKDKALRIAAGAVVVSHEGRPTTVWKGLLGGQQSIFRAEVLAGAVAVGAFSKVHVYSDCLSFVRIARRLANDWCEGRRPRMPSKHRDLWQYFWKHLTKCDQGNVEFSWVPSHQALGQLMGREAFEAQHNAVADAEAKSVLEAFVRRSEAYRTYVEKFQVRETCAKKLASLHAAIAYRAVAGTGSPSRDDPPSWTGADFQLDHPVGIALLGRAGPFGHPEYLSKLETFFGEVRWSPTSGSGRLVDTSWIELFVLCTRATGVLPPVWTGVRWALVGEDSVATVCNKEFVSLFRIWRKAIRVIGVQGFFADRLVARCCSCVELGLAFRPSGVAGRFWHAEADSSEFVFLAGRATSLGSVRVPFL